MSPSVIRGGRGRNNHMVSTKLLIFLVIGTVAMLLPISLSAKQDQIPWWKVILISILLTVVGTIGTKIMFYIENHAKGGQSFYGAVFLIPVVFLFAAKLIRVPYGNLMDVSAPAVTTMLMLMKILCVMEGCCGGRNLRFLELEFLFPSQIAEMMNALLLTIWLVWMNRRGKQKTLLYPGFLVIYGITRLLLNTFRAKQNPFVWNIPAGHFWSLVAIVLGLIILLWKRKTKHT